MRYSIPLASCMLAAPLSLGAAQHAAPTFQARAFGDFNYTDTQRAVADGFRIGQIVGHVIAGLSDRVTFFTEVSATPSSSGFSVEAERVFIRYDHSDLLQLSAGRYHTPIAYWNTAYHHGQWLQTSVGRPDMVRVGSGLMPLHFVGVRTEGRVSLEPFGVRYAVGAGNGRGSSIARAGDAGDANKTRAFVANTSLAFPRQTALVLGGAYYQDRATLSATLAVDERITSIHLVREHESPEVIVEYARITHRQRVNAAPETHTNAAYAQLAYRLPQPAQAFKPYVRLERTRVPANDTLFGPLNLNYEGGLAGLRYDLAATAALKLEYRSERFDTRRRFRTIAVQLSFTFPSHNGSHNHHEPRDE